jgi:hypothetical protein
MTEITLTSEQANAISAAEGAVVLRHPDGSFVGWISPNTRFVIPKECPFTPEEIAAAEKEAETGPWHTTREVFEHIKSLADGRQ